mgnify:CR=1 FL=1
MNIIFDIDGTLMDINHRRHFVEGVTKDWKSFVANIKYDIPNPPVADVMRNLNNYDNNIYFLTGRNESERSITIEQIKDCGYEHQNQGDLKPKDDYERLYYSGGHYDEILLMRPDDDYRPDAELKSDLYDSINILHEDTIIFDDRQSVVDMWRARGLTCFQVAEGDF